MLRLGVLFTYIDDQQLAKVVARNEHIMTNKSCTMQWTCQRLVKITTYNGILMTKNNNYNKCSTWWACQYLGRATTSAMHHENVSN
jgi:hypothetical protein